MTRLAAVLTLLCGPAWAHDWYDPACCSGEDCAPVEVDVVTATVMGWLVEVDVGDHPLAKKHQTLVIPYDDPRIRRSLDQDFHVCLGLLSNRIYCVYVPDFGS